MKVGILTQPLHNNYGGLLQAYALQKYLKDQGHDVLTIDIPFKNKSLIVKLKLTFFNIIKRYILKRNIKSICPFLDSEKKRIAQYTSIFIKDNINLTKNIKSVDNIKELDEYKFDAYVVGSDQVWRPIYSPSISTYFLDFVNDSDNVIRVAYAASFGVDNCDEYSDELKSKCRDLLAKFDAIGVREDTAVELCKNEFDAIAQKTIDPTFLLNKEDYINLVEKSNTPKSDGNMMVYVLDQSQEKKSIIDFVAATKNLTPYAVMPDDKGVYPPVTQWIRGFMDAEFVVTDSFHGVVFSIIFNKPFIAIGNPERGLARFISILNNFDLMDRLLVSINDVNELILDKKIDHEKTNGILMQEYKKSEIFFNKALNENVK